MLSSTVRPMDDSLPDPEAIAAPPVAERSGSAWTDDQHRRLVAGLLDGLTVEALAKEFGRTSGAIRSRARLMVPVDEQQVGGSTAVKKLRELLTADPGYDWQAALNESRRAKGALHRTDADAAALVEAWEAGAPPPDLARDVTSVWVLTVYGIPGRPGHVSLHRTEAEAAVRRDELVRPLRDSDTGGALAWWCIAHRSPGNDDRGPSQQGTVVVGT